MKSLYSNTLLTLAFLFILQSSIAQEKYDLFYLVVGSEHYENLDDLEAASNAAYYMEQLFNKMGAIDGRSLTTTPNAGLSSKRLFAELKALSNLAKKSKSKNPLLIIYYAGHGFTSGVDKAYFIPPGNFDPKKMKEATQEMWIHETILPLDIKEKLDENNMDYLFLIDGCYEGSLKNREGLNSFEVEYFGLNEMDSLMKQTYAIFEAMNTMVGPDPVVFSCQPGQVVTTEPYDFGEGKVETGPLSRRAALILERKLKGMPVSVSDFIVMLLDPNIDPTTAAAFSNWKFDSKNLSYLRE